MPRSVAMATTFQNTIGGSLTVCDLVLGGKKNEKLPAWVYATLSGDLAYVVLKFQRVIAEVARQGDNYP